MSSEAMGRLTEYIAVAFHGCNNVNVHQDQTIGNMTPRTISPANRLKSMEMK